MDGARSSFGALPSVSEILDRIESNEGELVVNRSRDGREVVFSVPLDGSSKNNDILDTQVATTANWEADDLVVRFVGERRGKPISYTERWIMAPDHQSFKVARHLKSPRGETDQTLWMAKQ